MLARNTLSGSQSVSESTAGILKVSALPDTPNFTVVSR